MPLKDGGSDKRDNKGKARLPSRAFLAVKGLAGTLLGGFILYLLFERVSPLTVAVELARVNRVKLAAAVAFIGLSYFCRTAVWKRLLAGFRDYPYWALFRATMVGYLVNNILPARLGDVTRGAWLYRTQGGNSGSIFGSLALERVMDVALILTLLGISLAWLGLYYDWLVVSTAFLGVLIVVFFILAAALRRLALRDARSLPAVLISIKEWVTRFTRLKNPRTVVAHLGDSMSVANMRRGLVWSVITWFVTYWGLYFALASLGLTRQIGPVQAALILCVASLGIAVPSLPASLGTYQAAFVFGGMLVGVPEAQALAASFLYQGLWVGVTSACGLAALAWEAAGGKKHFPQRPGI